MGKLLSYLTIVVLFISDSHSQELTPQNIFNAYRTYINTDIQVEFDDTKFSIFDNNGEKSSKQINGKKVLRISQSGKYFLIANHAFPKDKSDYLITLIVFDNSGNEIFEKSIKAYFDMPHPLFAINDDGIAAGFDPLYFKLIMISGNELKEIAVIKDAPFEMERAAFIQADDKDFYVLSSIEPLSIENEKANVSLFRISGSDFRIEQVELDLSTPLLLKVIDNELYMSGIKFISMLPEPYIFKLTKNLNMTAMNKIPAERLIKSDGFLYAKFDDKIFKLNKQLQAEKIYSVEKGERVLDIAKSSTGIYALLKSDELYLLSLNSQLELLQKNKLNVQKISGTESLEFSGNKILLHTGDKTIEY